MSKKTKSEVADNSADTVQGGVLSENQAKLNKLNDSIQAAYERHRKIITDSKLYTYDKLSEFYGGKEWQELRKNKRRPQKCDVVNPFAGMVYCDDCGEKMYLSRRKNERPEQEHMRCSTYAKEQDKYSVHYIRTCVLNEIVLGELNKLLAMVKGNEEDFIKRVMSSSVQRKSSELTKAKKTLKQAEKRIAELDKLFTRLYEDNVLGRLSDERFTMMSAGYEDEQRQLKATVAELTAFVETAEQKSSDVSAFLNVIKQYEHITVLTPKIMHELIDRIVVHEADKSSGKRIQDIVIHYRFEVAVSTISVETDKYGKKVA